MSAQLAIVVFGVALVLATPLPAVSEGAVEGAPALPPARSIPGITVEDPFPHGCVDCHVNLPEEGMDARISTIMGRLAKGVDPQILAWAQGAAPSGVTLKGKHPPVAAAAFSDIPASCAKCHAKSSKMAPPLGPLLHRIHLSGGAKSHFLTRFQGECTYCHKLDAAAGTWSLPSGAER